MNFQTQAADIVFANAAQPIDPLQIPLHRVLATGYAAAAHTFCTLKARILAQALLLQLDLLHFMTKWTGFMQDFLSQRHEVVSAPERPIAFIGCLMLS